MANFPITIRGILKEDGTLVLNEKPNLPPGPIIVTLTSATTSPVEQDDTRMLIQRLWAERQTKESKSTARRGIEADIDGLRQELQEHANALDKLQQAVHKLKGKSNPSFPEKH